MAPDASHILSDAEPSTPSLGTVFGSKSTTLYQGVLATLLSGAGYVPLNPKFPAARNLHMLETAGCRTLVADGGFAAQQEGLLDHVSRAMRVVLPDAGEMAAYRSRFPRHEFFGAADVAAAEPLLSPPAVNEAAIAYLLFTSGSTGSPKGVMVAHRNVMHYLEVMRQRYDVQPTDRFSQTFDLTFDLSVADMFLCWWSGGCLCVPTANDMMARPGLFAKAN